MREGMNTLITFWWLCRVIPIWPTTMFFLWLISCIYMVRKQHENQIQTVEVIPNFELRLTHSNITLPRIVLYHKFIASSTLRIIFLVRYLVCSHRVFIILGRMWKWKTSMHEAYSLWIVFFLIGTFSVLLDHQNRYKYTTARPSIRQLNPPTTKWKNNSLMHTEIEQYHCSYGCWKWNAKI